MVFFYRNAVAPFSPGLAASPTLERTEIPFNRKAVASFPRLIKAARPPCGWVFSEPR